MQSIVIGGSTDGTIINVPGFPIGGGGSGDMKKSENLSGLSDYSQARVNLGLVPGSTIQVYSSALDALASVTSTAYGRSLLALTDASATRSSLSLVPGTNIQAYSPNLDTLAALNTTAYGRALLSLTDAASARTNFGLGSAATLTAGAMAGNVPVLDANGRILTSTLPPVAITDTFVVASQAAMLALTAERGDIAIRTDTNMSYVLATDSPSVLADWKQLLVPANNITGNAATATRLQTARNFSATGDATAPAVSFDGTANLALAFTLATSGVTAGTYGSASQIPVITVDAKGRVTTATTVTASGGGGGGALPAGGTAGQYLAKNSSVDGDASWVNPLVGFPVVVVARDVQNGSFQTVNGLAFTTITFNTGAAIDTHNGWNSSTNEYTVMQSGLYEVFMRIRLADNSGAVNFGIGFGTTNADGPNFAWQNFPAGALQNNNRGGGFNSIIFNLTAGQTLRMFTYIDISGTRSIASATFNMKRIR